jgi:4-carboxymuconolactone decarboxylase
VTIPLTSLPEWVNALLSSRKATQLNLYRALSNSPEAVESWLYFLWSLRDDFVTQRALRELLILRVAVRECSDYEWHHHVGMARAAGLRLEKIAAVGDPSAVAFDETDRLVLQLADAISSGRVSDEIAAKAAGRLGARAYVELCVTAAAYVMTARVLDALNVPLEDGVGGGQPRPDY